MPRRRLSPKLRLAIHKVLQAREAPSDKHARQLQAAYAEGRKHGAKTMLEFLQKQQAEQQAQAKQPPAPQRKQETPADLKAAKKKFAQVKRKRAASR